MKIQSVINFMNKIAPKNLAEDWDNSGLLIGNPNNEVKKIFVCLDVSEDVIKASTNIGANLIITHHPIIFHAIKSIRTDFALGRKISLLMKNDISVFAAHTNLDSAEGGVNDILADKIGLIDIKMFGDEEYSLGRIGKLSAPTDLNDFALHIKKVLHSDNIRIIRAGDFKINKVGICGGAGADIIGKAKFFGADVFVTGDLKYHEAQSAVENKIHVIDAGHFATEFPIVHALAEKLRAEFKDTEIAEDKFSQDFFFSIK